MLQDGVDDAHVDCVRRHRAHVDVVDDDDIGGGGGGGGGGSGQQRRDAGASTGRRRPAPTRAAHRPHDAPSRRVVPARLATSVPKFWRFSVFTGNFDGNGFLKNRTTWFYWVILVFFHWFYCVLLGFLGFYRVLQSSSGFCLVIT